MAEVLGRAAAQLIGTRLGRGDDDAACRSAVLRRVVVTENLHLLHRVHRRIDIHLPDAEPHVLPGATVNPEHLALRAATRQAEVRLRAGVIRDEYRRARHLDQIHGAAIAERHPLDRARLDELTELGGPRRKERRFRTHRHGIGELADRELDIERHRRTGRQRQALATVAVESG